MKRLELKGKKFDVFNSATDLEIDTFWEELLSIDPALRYYKSFHEEVAFFK